MSNSSQIPAFSNNDFIMSLAKSAACMFGAISNAICVAVFLSPKLKDVSFKYMLAHSISDLIYMGSLTFQFLINYPLDNIRLHLAVHLYNIILYTFFTSILAIFSILVEIWISFQRYFMIKKIKYFANISYTKGISTLTFISFVYYFLSAFIYKIVSIDVYDYSTKTNKTFFILEKTYFAQSAAGKILFIFLEILRIFFNSILLSIINVLFMVEFKKISLKRAQLRAKYNLTGY